MIRRYRHTWVSVAILGSYIVVTLALFLPVLSRFTTAAATSVQAGTDDAWQNVWMLWWFHRAVTLGQSPFWTNLLFYPTGADLFWQTLNSPADLLMLPVTHWVNPVAAYNLYAMATFAVSGMTMYLLASRLSGSRSAGWIAGMLFAFAPFHLTALYHGQLETLSIQYHPLFALSLWRGLRERSWGWTGLAAMLLILITLTNLYYGLFALIFLGVFGGLELLRERRWQALRAISYRAVAVVAPLGLLLLPRLIGGQHPAGLPDWRLRQAAHSLNPLDLLMPNPYEPLWRERLAPIVGALHPTLPTNMNLGIVVLLLALAGLWWRRVVTRGWIGMAAILGAFALGPYLVINGRSTGMTLPYWLIDQLPSVKQGQRPDHLLTFASMALCVAAAFGWQACWSRVVPRWRPVLAGAIVAALALDLWPTAITPSAPALSPFYATLAAAPPGAVLELPFHYRGSDAMRAQLFHGRPLAGGYLARIPEYPAIGFDGLRQLADPDHDTRTLLYANWTDAIIPALKAYKIAYVVLHFDQGDRDLALRIQPALQSHLQRVYADEGLAAYKVPDGQSEPLVSLAAGWFPLEQQPLERWAWSTPTAGILIQNPHATPAVVQLQVGLDVPTGAPWRLMQQVNGHWQTLVTTAGTAGLQHLSFGLVVGPGQTNLRFSFPPTHAPAPDRRVLGARFTTLNLLPVADLPAVGAESPSATTNGE